MSTSRCIGEDDAATREAIYEGMDGLGNRTEPTSGGLKGESPNNAWTSVAGKCGWRSIARVMTSQENGHIAWRTW